MHICNIYVYMHKRITYICITYLHKKKKFKGSSKKFFTFNLLFQCGFYIDIHMKYKYYISVEAQLFFPGESWALDNRTLTNEPSMKRYVKVRF